MSNNNITGDKVELDVEKVRKKQMDKKYNNPAYFNEVKSTEYEPKDNVVTQDADMSTEPKIETDITSDDGHKEAYDPETEYIKGDSKPSFHQEQADEPKRKRAPNRTLPWDNSPE